MKTQGDQSVTHGSGPVGDHRRLHDLLLELRRRAGDPSLRKINSSSGVSVGHLSEIFAGKTAPGPDVAARIAEALKGTDREQARARFYAEGVEADRSAQRSGDGRRERRPGWVGSPYLGLAPFEEQHARIFYGRRALILRLLELLRERTADAGVLLILGPSGAGKSSVLRAGLMGSLAGDVLAPGCQFWPRRVITPGADPVRQLAVHLAELAGGDAISVHEALVASPGQAHLLAEQALAAAGLTTTAEGGGPRLVLVVDQLEELFSLTSDPGEQERFLTVLHSMATTPVRNGGGPAALVVAGIRGDFLDQAMAFPAMRQAAEAGVFAVGAMSESELREAVAGPAAEAGVRVPDDVCAAVLDDLRERGLPVGFDSGTLPLLSQVMFIMWQARTAAGLTLEGYHRTGGVAGIVRTSAERVYDSLDAGQQDLTRRLFLHLTAVTDGRLTRRPSTRSALRAATGSDDTALVVEAFAGQRLLTVADNGLVTVAHEELLRSWDRLRDWLQPSLTDQALHRALTEDVQTWQEHHRDPSYLYQGGRLLAVDDAVGHWTDDPAGQLAVDPAARDFLHASHRRARRRRRTYQAVAAGMILLLMLTGATAVLLKLKSGEAEHSAADARTQYSVALSRLLADGSRTVGPTDRATSEQLAAAAFRVQPTVQSLGAVSSVLAGSRSVFPGDSGIAGFDERGTLLATAASKDGTVWLWDTATGRRVGAPLSGHTAPVRSIAFGPGGKTLATASDDGLVRLWDTSTGRQIGAPLAGHDGPVVSVAFGGPAGRSLVSAGDDGTVRLWNPETGRQAGAPLRAGAGPLDSAVFGPRGRLLAGIGKVAHGAVAVRLWDRSTRRPRGAPLVVRTARYFALTFSPDGKRVATAGGDSTVQLWDTATALPVGAPLAGHTKQVYALTFSSDGKTLATAGEDRTVRLWDPATRRARGGPLTGHSGAIRSLRFSPDGRLLASASDDLTARLWNPLTGHQVGSPLTGHTAEVTAVRFSRGGRMLATAGKDGTVRLWDPVTQRAFGAPLAGHEDAVNAVAFNPAGNLLASVSTDNMVRLWDPAAGRPRGTPLKGHFAPVRAVAFDPVDVNRLATAGDDGTIRLWNPWTGRQVGAALGGRSGPVQTLAFSPDGKFLATAGQDTRVWLWNLATRRPALKPLSTHGGAVRAVAFSQPDGKLLAGAGVGGTVQLWESATGHPVRELPTGHPVVHALAFSPRGLLATAGDDARVRLWDTATWQPVGEPLTGHGKAVYAVRFSPAGDLLASASDDHTVRLWDPATRKSVGVPLTGHIEPVYDVAFRPDGKRLATAGGDSTVRLWDPAIYRDPLAYLCGRTGGLSQAKWDGYADGAPLRKAC